MAQPDYFLVLDGIKGESRDKVMSTNHIPAGAKIVLKTVERTASL